jgi:protein SCO1/2
VVPLVLALVACGSDSSVTHELVGYRPSGEQVVNSVALPDASNGDAPFEFVAPTGGLLIVYFGYTSCPDVCPTTLAMLKSALATLGDDASRVSLAMATVDPNRDTGEILTGYVQSFVPTAHALRTDQPDELQAVADSFGAIYSVTTSTDGRIEVSHSGAMYVVNDQGGVVLTWPFGVVSADVAADLELLLAETKAPA